MEGEGPVNRPGSELAKMADDGGVAKRRKTAEDGGQDGVVTAEDTELRLRRRIAELESENEQLRRRGQGEGNHGVLPVTVTVDLSRVTTGIVTHISSFLGTSRELLNLALTCKAFGWRQPMSTLNWSLVEEVARQTVCSRATDAEIGCLPQYVRGTVTWLSILDRYEHLLDFDVLLGGYIEHRNGDKTAVCTSGDDGDYCCSVAVASNCVMKSGSHYAEFQITGIPFIGIVRPMPGLDNRAYHFNFCFIGGDHSVSTDFLAQRSDEWGDSDVHACEYFCGDGTMGWTNWDFELNEGVDLDGIEGCQSGDTVGMLLNLDEGTLTVYMNNSRLGVLKDGLSGPYCWYVNLFKREAVSIKRGTLPISDGATTT
ncbi:hypothetical protein THAOC_05522 [Thalassiosira oceanica]|uniref:B30.2/SPRY domain-containing protein n=1 Tax=Thalassiosira oceanica TaxID=159749 RepID=K0TMQ9_THAOC|nr:hypothetical protein THAOC_05522 [Thalassiosira oceanica]|eukprot:EJK72902.1 hypothetical protein THAOC_05522 [Thalassiosira oceanica]